MVFAVPSKQRQPLPIEPATRTILSSWPAARTPRHCCGGRAVAHDVLLSFQRSLRSGIIPGVGAPACANAQVRDEAVRESEPGREVVLFVPLPHDLGQANDGRARVHRYRSRDLRLGRELLAFRARYGLTQDEVARVVATSSAATISQWEAGHKVPDGLRRERLRELLDGRLWPELRTGLLALTDDLFHRMAGQPFAPMLAGQWTVRGTGWPPFPIFGCRSRVASLWIAWATSTSGTGTRGVFSASICTPANGRPISPTDHWANSWSKKASQPNTEGSLVGESGVDEQREALMPGRHESPGSTASGPVLLTTFVIDFAFQPVPGHAWGRPTSSGGDASRSGR